MNEKCTKYESMFVFASYTDFQKHLSQCADCQEEYLKMGKISSLINEVAPIYLASEKKMKYKKIMSCCAFLFFGLVSIIGFEMNNNGRDGGVYPEDSVIYDAGLPVDEYGLLEI